jgi:N-hydroxyarylamine O-acetyltransferase
VSLDLPAYFARIGLVDPRGGPADLDLLRRLHFAHAAAIVFENLDIQRGLPVRLDLDSLQAKLVTAGRGGYCFEQNALLATVLEALGYSLTRLCGRVRLGRPGQVPPRTHMILRVELPEGPHLADVGFGALQLLEPMPLHAGATATQHGWDYTLVPEGAGLLLRMRQPEGWIDLYEFTEEPQHPIDYEVANHFTATHPSSGFVQSLTVQRATPGVRYTLRNRGFEELTPEHRSRRELADPDELLALLGERFGLHFPPGTRFRNPEF